MSTTRQGTKCATVCQCRHTRATDISRTEFPRSLSSRSSAAQNTCTHVARETLQNVSSGCLLGLRRSLRGYISQPALAGKRPRERHTLACSTRVRVQKKEKKKEFCFQGRPHPARGVATPLEGCRTRARRLASVAPRPARLWPRRCHRRRPRPRTSAAAFAAAGHSVCPGMPYRARWQLPLVPALALPFRISAGTTGARGHCHWHFKFECWALALALRWQQFEVANYVETGSDRRCAAPLADRGLGLKAVSRGRRGRSLESAAASAAGSR